MADLIKRILLTMVVFLGIDFVWLGLVAKKFYDKEFAAFSRTIRWPVAILDYVLIVVGLVMFVLPKASGNQFHAFLWGALFGLIGYGVYDLTNWATLKDWTLRMTAVDMLWGATVCGLVSLIMTVIMKGGG